MAEPDGVHSLDCVWKISNKCFELWKNVCYVIMTTCCGICIAMEWGCEFAAIAFYHIWFLTPCVKVLEINCVITQKVLTACMNGCCVPLCEACAVILKGLK